MNFFAHQEQARSQTKRLVALFAVAVVLIVAAINLVVLMAFATQAKRHGESIGAGLFEAHPNVVFWTTLITLAVIGLGTLFKTSSLRAGGGAVAREFGATLIAADTTNFAHRRLRNVVEEIAIASGVPVPEIYVLDGESGINAFAAGFTPADAAVCVTRGCLEKLSRDELQGVIAHEFSHVLNGDMRLNIRLMGILFGILLIALAGQKVLENTRGGDRDRGAGAILGVAIALMVIGYIGLFFGRLIKAGVSRQREFLADASAVQFTRQPTGIAGALKKIGGLAEGSHLAAAKAEEVSHMLFGDGVGYSALFATHPPLVERIRRIEPRFDAAELDEIGRRWSDLVHVADDAEGAGVSISGLAPRSGAPVEAHAVSQRSLPAAANAIAVEAAAVVAQVGTTPSPRNQGDEIGAGIPEKLRASAYMQDRAPGLVLALALDPDDALRRTQLERIAQALGGEHESVAAVLFPLAQTLHPMQRLPLAALAFPALRRLPRPFLGRFVAALDQVIHADGDVALGEYCLAKLVASQVIDALNPAAARITGKRHLRECRQECADLFAVLARDGNADEQTARRAYMAGIAEVDPNAPAYAPAQDWIAALDAALPQLDRLEPTGKELLLQGLVKTMSHDGRITVAESELLRAECAALHCPLPPMLS
jgi:Zn-dependent protease with chaperone function